MTMRSTAHTKFQASAAVALLSLALLAGCKHSSPANSGLKPTAQGTALVESSGGHQLGVTGTALKDPLVVQVNDDQGAAVPGAQVEFHGPAGISFDPAAVLTDSSGQRNRRPISAQRRNSRQGQTRVARHCGDRA